MNKLLCLFVLLNFTIWGLFIWWLRSFLQVLGMMG